MNLKELLEAATEGETTTDCTDQVMILVDEVIPYEITAVEVEHHPEGNTTIWIKAVEA